MVNIQQDSQLAQKYHKELAKIQAIQGIYNDVTTGQYDVRIATGADYNTQREESRELLMELGRNNPQLLQVAGDLIVKAFDFKDADKLAERLKKALPPQFQDEDEDKPQLPPQVMAQVQQMQQAMGQMQQQLQQAQGELHSRDSELQKDVFIAQLKANTDIEIAKLKLEGQENTEEIKGMVQLLLQHMTPPEPWVQQANAPDFDNFNDPAQEQGFSYPPEQSQMPHEQGEQPQPEQPNFEEMSHDDHNQTPEGNPPMDANSTGQLPNIGYEQ